MEITHDFEVHLWIQLSLVHGDALSLVYGLAGVPVLSATREGMSLACVSTQHADHPSLNCLGPNMGELPSYGKQSLERPFFRGWLVCVGGVSAKRAGDTSSAPSGGVSVQRGGSEPFAGVGSMAPFCLWIRQTQQDSGSSVLDFD